MIQELIKDGSIAITPLREIIASQPVLGETAFVEVNVALKKIATTRIGEKPVKVYSKTLKISFNENDVVSDIRFTWSK